MPPVLSIKLAAAKNPRSWQLVLDKFPLIQQSGVLRLPEKKLDALKPLTNAALVVGDWSSAIKSNLAFLDKLEKQHGHRFRRVTLVNSSRLLLHLGRASVLENVGLHCDRTTGLPVIPGSAVKGIISTWACWESHFNEADGSFGPFDTESTRRNRFADSESARLILGDNASSSSTAAGVISILGAWPAAMPTLGLDIVTPHYDAAGREKDPSPNPFLCIEPGTAWQFVLLASPRNSGVCSLLDTADRWLREALEQSGIGAKTAAGYGRFMDEACWKDATMTQADRARDTDEARRQQEREANEARAKASTIGDYTDVTFKGAVLDLLDQPGQAQRLQAEIKRIRDNPANQPWIAKITEALRGKEMRDHRKRLKEKDWFPTDWLPQ